MEPKEGALEAVFDGDVGHPAQLSADFFDVDDASSDVVDVATVDVGGRAAARAEGKDVAGELIDRNLTANTNIINLSFGL